MVYKLEAPKTSQAGIIKNSATGIIASSVGTINPEMVARTKTTIASLLPLPASANLLTLNPKSGSMNKARIPSV